MIHSFIYFHVQSLWCVMNFLIVRVVSSTIAFYYKCSVYCIFDGASFVTNSNNQISKVLSLWRFYCCVTRYILVHYFQCSLQLKSTGSYYFFHLHFRLCWAVMKRWSSSLLAYGLCFVLNFFLLLSFFLINDFSCTGTYFMNKFIKLSIKPWNRWSFSVN